MKYFTSDLHFHHPLVAAIRGYTYPEYAHINAESLRAYAKHNDLDIADMVNWRAHDKQIIDNINATVGADDELYILGDLSTGGMASMNGALDMIDQFNVPRDNRHLILGNHDMPLVQRMGEQLLHRFATISMNSVIDLNGRNVMLSHFQYRHHFLEPQPKGHMSTNACAREYAWNALVDDDQSLLMHGHTHARTPFEFDNPREINVGMDAWHMRPVGEIELVQLWGPAIYNYNDLQRLIAQLKEIRQQHGLSVEDLAERMNITVSELEQFEQGDLPADMWNMATALRARITSSVEPAETQPDGNRATNKKEQQ